LQYVIRRSSFYRDYYQGYDLGDLESLPVIDKAIMMENFDTLNTAGISKDEAFSVALKAERSRDFTISIRNITIGLSSGTSGNRGLFLASPKERYL